MYNRAIRGNLAFHPEDRKGLKCRFEPFGVFRILIVACLGPAGGGRFEDDRRPEKKT